MPLRKGYGEVPRKESAPADRDKLLTQAYGAATARVRDNHRDEFNRFYQEEAEKRGLDWKPKLTAEQKAEQTLLDLLDEFPHLSERLRGRQMGEPSWSGPSDDDPDSEEPPDDDSPVEEPDEPEEPDEDEEQVEEPEGEPEAPEVPETPPTETTLPDEGEQDTQVKTKKKAAKKSAKKAPAK